MVLVVVVVGAFLGRRATGRYLTLRFLVYALGLPTPKEKGKGETNSCRNARRGSSQVGKLPISVISRLVEDLDCLLPRQRDKGKKHTVQRVERKRATSMDGRYLTRH